MSKVLHAHKHPLGGFDYHVSIDNARVASGSAATKQDLAELQEYHNCDTLEILGEIPTVPPLNWVIYLRLIAWTIDRSGILWDTLRRGDRRRIALIEIAHWLMAIMLLTMTLL